MLGFVIGVLTFLEIFIALLLTGIILIQESKAGGGLGAMGGGVTETVFGASAGNVLTKGTVVLASIFLVNTLALDIITGHTSHGKSVVETVAPAAPKSTETETGAKAKKTEAAAAKTSAAKTTVKAVPPSPASGTKTKKSKHSGAGK